MRFRREKKFQTAFNTVEAESRKLNFIYDPEGAVQFCSITDANVHKRMAS